MIVRYTNKRRPVSTAAPVEQYRRLRELLISARKRAGLTQAEVAARLHKPQSYVSKYERGERRVDVIEFLQIARILKVRPNAIIAEIESELSHSPDILTKWQITPYDLTALLQQSPSLRGMLFGYVAELKLEQLWLQPPMVTESVKYDNHDRQKKGDRLITYKDESFVIEVKSLQTNTISFENGRWAAKAQVDASDRRTITLPNGTEISTTCLLVGEFDVLAVNVYSFEDEWRFVFAKNEDLPRSRYRRYPSEQRQYLLATTVDVTWPPEPPFSANLFPPLNQLLEQRRQERID